jgi:tetratricopeptide (TPR) repeat protein
MSVWPTKKQSRILGLVCLLIGAMLGLWGYRLFVPSVAQLRRNCLQAAAADEWNSVELNARRWTHIAPGSGEPWMQLGNALARQRKFQAAQECFRNVPEGSPEAEEAAISEIDLLFGPLNSPTKAAIVCEEVLGQNPQSRIGRQRLIFFLAMTLQRTELMRQIRAAIEQESEPIEAYVYLFMVDSLMFSNGIETNSRWLRGEPESELFEVAQVIFVAETLDFSISLDDLAAAQAARRDAARKESVMKKLLAKYPHNAELLAYIIRKRIESGDVPGVVELLAQSTVDCETDPRFWRFKGWVHKQRQELAECRASCRRAIELNPLDWVTRYMLSDVLQQHERFDEVKVLREISVRGRNLQNSLRNAPSAREVPPKLLLELADYAESCGDEQVSRALRKRIPNDQGR